MPSPTADNIQDYVQAFQRGEEAGFTYFFHSLHPALTCYAFRFVDDRPIAEEIVGGAFIRIWQRHAAFSHPGAISSWLYITVRNDCLHHLKRKQKTQLRQEQLARYRESDHETPVLHEMIRAETLREIYTHIENLPGACRNIFRMIYIQGKTVREIAGELQLSISTVKSQKAKGLALLRNRFTGPCIFLLLEAASRC